MPTFGTCKVRFYYCAYGNAISTLQLIVQPLNGQPAKIIWTPPSNSFTDQRYYCEWMKISADLPEQVNSVIIYNNLLTNNLLIL